MFKLVHYEGLTSGWLVSYWNDFLFHLKSYIWGFPYILVVVKCIEINLYKGARVNHDTVDFERFCQAALNPGDRGVQSH